MSAKGIVESAPDGRSVVIFVRELEHPVDRVWAAVTQAEYLRLWFPAEIDFTLEVGEALIFRPTAQQRARYGATDADATSGTVTALDPPHLLEFTWGADLLRWELVGDSSRCRLTFRHTVEDAEEGRAQIPGWHAGLDAVEAGLRGEAIDLWAEAERYEALYR